MTEIESPFYASRITPEAISMREELPETLRSAVIEISDQLALNPQDFANRIQKLPAGKNCYVYEHPDPPFQITYQLVQDNDSSVIEFIHFAALKMNVQRVLFISYSSKDLKWMQALKKYLGGLESEDMAIWDDRQIEASADWEKEIERALVAAKAALLLVSQEFLTSEFISKKELPFLLDKAEQNKLKIFWLPLSASTVKDTPIFKYQAVVDNPAITMDELSGPKRKKKYLQVYEKIKAAMAADQGEA